MAWRVLFVDDHPLVATGVGRILAPHCAAFWTDATLAAARARLTTDDQLDCAIVDLHLPDGPGLELLGALSPRGVPAIILTGTVTASAVRASLAAGARGFVAKTAGPATLIEAVPQAIAGQQFLCEHARRALDAEALELSPREALVLALVGAGRTNKEIAQQLGIAARTVETHRERIMRKLGAHNTADLTREAIRRGLAGQA